MKMDVGLTGIVTARIRSERCSAFGCLSPATVRPGADVIVGRRASTVPRVVGTGLGTTMLVHDAV